jgi:hypothetical protein
MNVVYLTNEEAGSPAPVPGTRIGSGANKFSIFGL